MKELSIEQKAKRYDEAIERARNLYNSEETSAEVEITCENIFPELKESEVGRIRKALIRFHKNTIEIDGIKGEDIITWLEKQGETFTKKDVDDAYLKGVCDAKQELEKQGKVPVTVNIEKMVRDYANNKERGNEEFGKPVNCMIRAYRQGLNDAISTLVLNKQGEQKPVDKIEPKFKVGDWVVCEVTGSVYQIKDCIENVTNHKYSYNLTNGGYIPTNGTNDYHLWTIEDAKDGDVLAVTMYSGRVWIGIFKEYNGRTFSSYCFMNTEGVFMLGASGHGRVEAIHPATKEQQDTLFKAMADAGYEFDFEKKELKKIEQHGN